MKKVLNFGLIAFLVFYVVTQPDNAAAVLRQIGQWLKAMAVGFGEFISNLA